METNGQSSGPDRWFPGHRASSYTYFPWDRLHEQYGPSLRGSKTRFEAVVSSSFSCFQISLRTPSLASYPNTRRRGEPGEVYQQCRIWYRMSFAGFPFQRLANGLPDGRDLEGILF